MVTGANGSLTFMSLKKQTKEYIMTKINKLIIQKQFKHKQKSMVLKH